MRHLYALVDPKDREAFGRVLGIIAKTVDAGEVTFTVSRGQLRDARVTRKGRIPEGPEAGATLDRFFGLDIEG